MADAVVSRYRKSMQERLDSIAIRAIQLIAWMSAISVPHFPDPRPFEISSELPLEISSELPSRISTKTLAGVATAIHTNRETPYAHQNVPIYIKSVEIIHSLVKSVLAYYISRTLHCVKTNYMGASTLELLKAQCDEAPDDTDMKSVYPNVYTINVNDARANLEVYLKFVGLLEFELTLLPCMLISEMLYYLPQIVNRFVVHYQVHVSPKCMSHAYLPSDVSWDFTNYLFGRTSYYFNCYGNAMVTPKVTRRLYNYDAHHKDSEHFSGEFIAFCNEQSIKSMLSALFVPTNSIIVLAHEFLQTRLPQDFDTDTDMRSIYEFEHRLRCKGTGWFEEIKPSFIRLNNINFSSIKKKYFPIYSTLTGISRSSCTGCDCDIYATNTCNQCIRYYSRRMQCDRCTGKYCTHRCVFLNKEHITFIRKSLDKNDTHCPRCTAVHKLQLCGRCLDKMDRNCTTHRVLHLASIWHELRATFPAFTEK
jgi:hypothetical protein